MDRTLGKSSMIYFYPFHFQQPVEVVARPHVLAARPLPVGELALADAGSDGEERQHED